MTESSSRWTDWETCSSEVKTRRSLIKRQTGSGSGYWLVWMLIGLLQSLELIDLRMSSLQAAVTVSLPLCVCPASLWCERERWSFIDASIKKWQTHVFERKRRERRGRAVLEFSYCVVVCLYGGRLLISCQHPHNRLRFVEKHSHHAWCINIKALYPMTWQRFMRSLSVSAITNRMGSFLALMQLNNVLSLFFPFLCMMGNVVHPKFMKYWNQNRRMFH